jgi:hypothetical protein
MLFGTAVDPQQRRRVTLINTVTADEAYDIEMRYTDITPLVL